MLIEHGEYARITGMIDYLTQKAKTPEIRRLKIALAELEVSYYKAIEDKENLFSDFSKAAVSFYMSICIIILFEAVNINKYNPKMYSF